MTWKLARDGIFTQNNEARWQSMLKGGRTYIRETQGRLTIGDERGHVRWLFVHTPERRPAEPSEELWEKLHDSETTKVSGKLTFPWGAEYYVLHAQTSETEAEHIGYCAPKELWLDAELEVADSPEMRERILRAKRAAYESETGLLPDRPRTMALGKKRRKN